jgi:hypothetical protein
VQQSALWQSFTCRSRWSASHSGHVSLTMTVSVMLAGMEPQRPCSEHGTGGLMTVTLYLIEQPAAHHCQDRTGTSCDKLLSMREP